MLRQWFCFEVDRAGCLPVQSELEHVELALAGCPEQYRLFGHVPLDSNRQMHMLPEPAAIQQYVCLQLK
jgi:hypothetical protein